MTNVDFESILITVIDKCRFRRCDYADFRCRMAGHEDYLDARRADQYGFDQGSGGAVDVYKRQVLGNQPSFGLFFNFKSIKDELLGRVRF